MVALDAAVCIIRPGQIIMVIMIMIMKSGHTGGNGQRETAIGFMVTGHDQARRWFCKCGATTGGQEQDQDGMLALALSVAAD